MRVLVLCVDAARSLPQTVSLGGVDLVYVVDAPDELIRGLPNGAQVTYGQGVQVSFQQRYIAAMAPLFDCERQPWAQNFAPEVRELAAAAVLSASVSTWKIADLLFSLAELRDSAGWLDVEVIHDSLAGELLWRELRLVRDTLGLRSVTGTSSRGADTSSTVARRTIRQMPLRLQGIARKVQDAVTSPEKPTHVGGGRSLGSGVVGRVPEAWQSLVRDVQDIAKSAWIFGHALPRPKGKTLFLIGESERMWTHLDPVYRACVAEGIQVYALVTRVTAESRMRKRGIHTARAPMRLLPLTQRAAVRAVVDAAPMGSPNPPGSESAERCHHAIKEVLWRAMAPMLNRMHSAQVAAEELAASADVGFLHSAGPYHPVANVLSAAARRQGATVFQMPHGLIWYEAPAFRYHSYADYYFAWGELMIEGYGRSAWPHPDTSWVPAGSPLLERKLDAVAPVERQMTVLVAYGRVSRVLTRVAFEAAVVEVFDAARQHPDLYFAVKPHPSDTTSFWTERITSESLPNVRLECGDFYEALGRSGTLVTMHSTAGAEAICAGRVTISVSVDVGESKSSKRPDFVEEGAAYLVQAPGQLAKVFDELRSAPVGEDRLAPARRIFAERFLHREERPAGYTIAQSIVHALGRRASGVESASGPPTHRQREIREG